jgi:hypothetical protein
MKNPACAAVTREAEEDWGKTKMAMTGKNRIMIYGPKDDGTYVVEFNSRGRCAIDLDPKERRWR